MTTTLQRRQLTPIFALLALAGTLVILLSVGMAPLAAITSGGLFAVGCAAAVWGMTEPGARPTQRIRWLLWPQIAAVITITWLAYLRLIPTFIGAVPHSDKVMHFLLFGAVTFFAELWLRDRRVAKIPVSIVLPATLAAMEEGMQHFSPARTMDIGDLLCDLSGMTIAFLLARMLYRSGK